MGSVAVVLSRSGPPAPDAVRRALAAAPHRGEQQSVVVHGRAALGIANTGDLADASLAAQDDLYVVFVGALDNREALNEELRRQGVSLREATPAATVAAAFRAWGDEAPTRLRGVFAGVVSDGTTLRCFRDHLGREPLFSVERPDVFVAATEAKQALAGAGLPREPHLEGVENLFYGRVSQRQMPLRWVERIPGGTLVTADDKASATLHRYWNPEELVESSRLGVSKAIKGLRDALDTAVTRSVTGTDAVSLSGGLDSPVVAALAQSHHREISGRPLQAVSAVYPHLPSVDESSYIELVAEYLGLDLHTYVQRTSHLDDVEFWVDRLDGPWPTVPFAEAAERAALVRELGARTVLSGDMIEYLCTVTGFLIGHLVTHARVRPAARWYSERRRRGVSRRALAAETARTAAPKLLAVPYLRLARNHYRKQDLARFPATWIDPAEYGGLGHRPVYRRPARKRWIGAQLDPVFARLDAYETSYLVAASCGVRERMPLADVDLWEFFLSLRAETKIPDRATKRLVREAMRGRLPEEILFRKDKTVFTAHFMETADYPALRRRLTEPSHRLRGIDYDRLARRLEAEEMQLVELARAWDLAKVHAFLSLWD